MIPDIDRNGLILSRDLDYVPCAAQDTVLSIGNFDGIHRGHQHVLTTCRQKADAIGAKVGILTFEPHPRVLFRPDDPPFRLTPARDKIALLGQYGADYVVAQHFTRDFAALRAEQFLEKIFHPAHRIRHIVIGHDFCFGYQRKGTVSMIIDAAHRHGCSVESLPLLSDDIAVTSSRIRDLARAGQITDITRLLGRNWHISGQVETGRQLARSLGFPTANITIDDYLCPAKGVYAVSVGIGHNPHDWYHGIANIGTRPTVDGTVLRLEAHLLDGQFDLYGRYIRVRMLDFIRSERHFESIDALKNQITHDIAHVKSWFDTTYKEQI